MGLPVYASTAALQADGCASPLAGSFNILVYTGTDTQVPTQWQDSNAHLISGNAEQVKLRSFSTSVHKVDSLVAYRLGDD